MKKWISKAVIAFLAAVTLLTVLPATTEAETVKRPKQHNINLKSKKKTQSITISKGNDRVWLMVDNRFTGGNWKSSNRKVATVSKYGEVKARKVGRTAITFKTGKTTLKWNVKVVNPKTYTLHACLFDITVVSSRNGKISKKISKDAYAMVHEVETANIDLPRDDYKYQLKLGNKVVSHKDFSLSRTSNSPYISDEIYRDDHKPFRADAITETFHSISGKSYVVKYMLMSKKSYKTWACKKYHSKVKSGQIESCPGCDFEILKNIGIII